MENFHDSNVQPSVSAKMESRRSNKAVEIHNESRNHIFENRRPAEENVEDVPLPPFKKRRKTIQGYNRPVPKNINMEDHLSEAFARISRLDDERALENKGSASKSEERSRGRIEWFNKDRGYGNIIPINGGEKVFFHASDVKTEDGVEAGEVVEYQLMDCNHRKLQAINVTIPQLTEDEQRLRSLWRTYRQ